MNQPLVSIIIPYYNQEDYLLETLSSIFSQSYNNYEAIIVNDGSTRKKAIKVLEGINHPKVKIITTPNSGLASARNTGIKHSNGEFILPLDADDKISPTYIEEAVDILTKHYNIKIVCCEVEFFGAGKGRMALPEYSIEIMLGRNTMVCSSLFRRSDYDKTIGYNPNMKFGFEDWDFWLSLLENGGEVYRIPKVHFYYRVKKKSMITALGSNTDKLKYSRRQIYQNHKHIYNHHFLDPTESFEYRLISLSKEYRLGKFLLFPIRYLLNILYNLNLSGK